MRKENYTTLTPAPLPQGEGSHFDHRVTSCSPRPVGEAGLLRSRIPDRVSLPVREPRFLELNGPAVGEGPGVRVALLKFHKIPKHHIVVNVRRITS